MDTSDEYFDCRCRTCMNELVQATPQDGSAKPLEQWQSIFDMIEEEDSAFGISELLTNAVPQIEVQPSDELPKRICSKCIQQLLSFYRFQRMCLHSEEQMRQQLTKKQACSEMMAAMEGEIGTNDTALYPLTSFQPNNTDQNIVHSSIQKRILETTEQMVEPDVARSSDVGNDQSLEHCNESQGELVKNEPIEDDEPSFEYSDGETTLSALSVKDEEWSIDTEEQQITETNVKALGIAQGEGEPYECPHCSRRFRTESDMLQHKAIHKGGTLETCDICGKSMFKKHLKTHKLIHSDQKPHKCDFCEKSFLQLHYLRVHIRKHTGEKPYKCKYCDRSFAGISLRLQHMRFHFGANIYRCELCPVAFPLASELRVHFLTHINDDPETRERNLKALEEAEAKLQLEVKKGGKRKTCDICGESIIKSALKQHKLSHKDEKPHKCNICEKSFAQLGNLRRHIRKHTGEKPYKCKYCDRSFAGSSLRAQHMRFHLGANIYRCELCPLAFPLASELRVHFLTHKNEDPETRERNLKALKEAEAKLQLEVKKGGERKTCDICGESIIKSALKQHKLSHKDEKPHKCNICEKSFALLGNLRLHIRKHTGEKPYKCKYCDRSFAGISLRVQHMRFHLGANIYRCELCPLAFPLASELRVHFLTHKNEDPETRERNLKALKEAEAKLQLEVKKGGKRKTCDICGESIIKSALKQHKLSHKDENPHKCNICEKSFAQLCKLRVHIRIHTGEKPYKCKYCERSYSQNIDRMKHMRLHFGDNIHRCELCPLAFPVASELRVHLTTHKNDAPETRERNLKALKEIEAEFLLKFSKQKTENVKALGLETCDICGKSMFKRFLKTHKLIHSDQKPHKCDFCEKRFVQLSNLRLHTRKHTGEKPYKCKYCDRSFAGISLRAQHMRFHLGVNIYRCDLCPLAFPLVSELRAHFLTHKNEDPETRERNLKALKEAEAKLQLDVKKGGKRKTCDICGESIIKTALKQHKLSHKDEKPHKCNICEKSFAQLSNLRVHIRIHTGEKPYKCKYCERSYSQMKHMRLHFGDNIHRCELCPLAFPVASELRIHLTTHKNDAPETRERNLKALKEVEAELLLKFSKQKTNNK